MNKALFLIPLFALAAPPLGAADLASPSFPAEMDIPLESVLPGGANARPAVVKLARPLRAGAVLSAGDLIVEEGDASALDPFVGMELKTTIYADRALSPNDVGMPTVVQRNAMVLIEFQRGPLLITTEGRALDAGAVGDAVRVMNLNSKVVLTAVITGPNKARTR